MKMRSRTTLAVIVASLSLACRATVPDDVPVAYVSKIADTTVATGDGRLTLDVGYRFDAWEDGKPTYDDLAEYLKSKGDAVRLAYLDWIADFTISFDRDIDAGDIALYGQTELLGTDWLRFDMRGLKANEEMRLLDTDAFSYSTILEDVVSFCCGARSDLVGTTMKVALRLYEPNGGPGCVSIAEFEHRFAPRPDANWFDARIPKYARWPEDGALAWGGAWESDMRPLASVASVPEKGVLAVASESPLSFLADDAKRLGEDARSVTVVAEVGFETFSPDNLPGIDGGDMGGVLLVEDKGVLSYYGVARIGERNEWVKLEGPDADAEGCGVKVKMTIRKKDGCAFVGYSIGGVDYSYRGSTSIALLCDGELVGVDVCGYGTVRSLVASAERPKGGMAVFLR